MSVRVCWGGVGVVRTSDAPPFYRIVLEPRWALALSILAANNGRDRGSEDRVWSGERGEQRHFQPPGIVSSIVSTSPLLRWFRARDSTCCASSDISASVGGTSLSACVFLQELRPDRPVSFSPKPNSELRASKGI